jgi:quinolinate synthase
VELQQVDIGSKFYEQSEEILAERIAARKKELGEKLLVLCHHYQQESVYRFADMTGDSLKLAKHAAACDDKPYIIFCGVHFMAESADILTGDNQAVILPDLRAGCPMADMASLDEVTWAWKELAAVTDTDRIIPVTYVNSSAAIKAFVGERQGSVCTSSNVFFPDEHLGRNSAIALGIKPEEIVLWNRDEHLGGNSEDEIKKAKVILWNGYCTVHMQFNAAHVRMWREKDPDIKIIVHPECTHEVVAASEQYGSTENIIKAVSSSPAGSSWAIGTEINLVNRLARLNPDKKIHSLSPFQCLCSTMYRIKPKYLLWVLDNLVNGEVKNQITVDPDTAKLARIALSRMLEI